MYSRSYLRTYSRSRATNGTKRPLTGLRAPMVAARSRNYLLCSCNAITCILSSNPYRNRSFLASHGYHNGRLPRNGRTPCIHAYISSWTRTRTR